MNKGTPYIGQTIRFTGIKVAAKRLDVDENHLRMVLRGKRTSRRLMDRVRAMFPALLGEVAK